MDKIIYNVPDKEFLTMRYLFKKEEEEYCPINREFSFLISPMSFFERINTLEKKIIEYEEFNSKKETSKKILNSIIEFKEKYYENVMEKKQYSCLLLITKKKEDVGFFGWEPKFYRKYLIDLKDKNYEERKKLCFLTEDEKKFKCTYKKKFDFLSLFFKEEYFYDGRYNIPTEDIIKFKRKYCNEIRQKCCHGNFVCPSDDLCRGHKFINFLEKIFEAITHCVIEEKVFYRYFLFYNIKKNDYDDFIKWDFHPSGEKDLSHLTYSKRLSFLN